MTAVGASHRAVPATLDAFIGGRVAACQPAEGRHRAGMDAVMLAAALPAGTSGRVVDLGAGVGVAGFCVAARLPGTDVTLVDNDPVAAALARDGLRLAANAAFAGRVSVVEADVTAPETARAAAGLGRGRADHVIMNPPFHAPGTVRSSPKAGRAAAHVLADAGIGQWLRAAASVLVDGGGVAVIWPAGRLPALLAGLENRFGDVVVFPLFPSADAAAIRIVVTARKGSRAPTKLLAGLVLHDADGAPSARTSAILRDGESLGGR